LFASAEFSRGHGGPRHSIPPLEDLARPVPNHLPVSHRHPLVTLASLQRAES